jgi:hypothetical protein
VSWPLVALWIATAVIAYAIRPKPKTTVPTAATLEEFQAPTAEDGREIPVLFGTREVAAPNVVWYGDLRTEPIKAPSGGK